MAHRAILRLQTATGRNEYEALSVHYEFSQNLALGPLNIRPLYTIPWSIPINPLRQFASPIPTSDVTGGVIEIKMATLPDDDTIIHRWMFSKGRAMDGQIKIDMSADNNRKKALHIFFTNGYCTYLKDEFDSQNARVMTTTFRITCERITIGYNIPATWPAFANGTYKL